MSDPAPTQRSPEVPEEAVIAAAKRSHPLLAQYKETAKEAALNDARLDLEAALPAIQAAERERLASVNRELPAALGGVSDSGVRDLILAALIVNEEEAAKRERERLRGELLSTRVQEIAARKAATADMFNGADHRKTIRESFEAALAALSSDTDGETEHDSPSYPLGSAPVVLDDGSEQGGGERG